jgi:hypothetical protein
MCHHYVSSSAPNFISPSLALAPRRADLQIDGLRIYHLVSANFISARFSLQINLAYTLH